MKEVAAFKWHKDGCYATAFATLLPSDEAAMEQENLASSLMKTESSSANDSILEPALKNQKMMTRQTTRAMANVQERREEKAQMTHWLAAGSKDGKVSLWDVF